MPPHEVLTNNPLDGRPFALPLLEAGLHTGVQADLIRQTVTHDASSESTAYRELATGGRIGYRFQHTSGFYVNPWLGIVYRVNTPTEIDLGELLDEVLHLHDAWAVELGVEVQREGPTTRVYADLGKLRRVFVNLVSNAMQAMSGGGELFVETVIEGAGVRISFRDTGEGIPDEAREHLFEPYFTTKSEGTGLGLAISKQVIEQMGGTIELASVRAGRGSVASVWLPLMGESPSPMT